MLCPARRSTAPMLLLRAPAPPATYAVPERRLASSITERPLSRPSPRTCRRTWRQLLSGLDICFWLFTGLLLYPTSNLRDWACTSVLDARTALRSFHVDRRRARFFRADLSFAGHNNPFTGLNVLASSSLSLSCPRQFDRRFIYVPRRALSVRTHFVRILLSFLLLPLRAFVLHPLDSRTDV